MKRYIILFFGIVFGCIGYFAWSLPISDVYEGHVFLNNEFDILPNIDFYAEAKKYIEKNEYESAIAIAEVGMEINPEDSTALNQIKEEAKSHSDFKNSPLGVATSFCDGFITGRIDSISSGAGSTLGDVFVYGDIRDLTKELVFSDDPDELIILLSTLGIVTSVAPHIDVMASWTKALRKISALSEPFVQYLKRGLSQIKNLDTASAIGKLNELLLPLYKLTENVKNLEQYKLLLRACKDNEAVKFISFMAKKNKKSLNDLTQILAVIGPKDGKFAQSVLDKIKQTDGKSIDLFKTACKKGKRGINIALTNPKLLQMTSRGAKLFSKFVPNVWKTFAKAMPKLAKSCKAFLFAILSTLSSLCFIKFISSFFAKKSNPKDINDILNLSSINNSSLINHKKLTIFLVLFIFFFALLLGFYTSFIQISSAPLSFNLQSGNNNNFYEYIIILPFIIIVIAILIACFVHVRNFANSIYTNQKLDSEQKLILIDNMDIYFDLPLYIGLGATILAFIIIVSTGAVNSRIIAYVATLAGILVTVFLRINILHNIKHNLLLNSMKGHSSNE